MNGAPGSGVPLPPAGRVAQAAWERPGAGLRVIYN